MKLDGELLNVIEDELENDYEPLLSLRNVPKFCLAFLVVLDFIVLIAVYVAAGFELGIIAFLRASFLQYNFYESTSDVFVLALVRLLCLGPYVWHLLEQGASDSESLCDASDFFSRVVRACVLFIQCGGFTFVLIKVVAIHYMDSVHSLVGHWLLSLVLCYTGLALILAELAFVVLLMYTERQFEKLKLLMSENEEFTFEKRKKKASVLSVRELLRSVISLWPYVWPKGENLMRLAFLSCVGLMILGRVFNVLLPMAYKSLINVLTNQTAADGTPHYSDFPTMFFLWYLAFYGLAKVMPDLRSFVFIYPQTFAQRKIQVETFDKLLNLGLTWHAQQETGKTLRTIMKGQDAVGQLLDTLVFDFTPACLDVVLVCVFLAAAYGWAISLLCLAGAVSYVLWTILATERQKDLRKKLSAKEGVVYANAIDALLNYETVKAFTREKHECDRYDHALNRYFSQMIIQQNIAMVIIVVQTLISTVTVALALLAAIVHNLTVGDIVAIVAYLNQIFSPLDKLGKMYRLISRHFTNLDNLFELLHHEVPVKDDENAPALRLTAGGIVFDNVCFSYNSRTKKKKSQYENDESAGLLSDSMTMSDYVLKNVSFVIRPSTFVAIVGNSGSGKSTICKLIGRYYDPTKGGIYIDDQNIKTVTQHSLRQSIGVVPQDVLLFNDTIAYNIAYGSREVDIDHLDVTETVKKAQLLSILDELHSVVGERGNRLSGGERQRMAIARIMLKSPAILILDEATSSLDSKTEAEIQKQFEEISSGRTTIVVAHKLKSIVHADNIIVLKNGAVVEQGRHEELISLGGEYYSMWATQQRELKRNSRSSSIGSSTLGSLNESTSSVSDVL